MVRRLGRIMLVMLVTVVVASVIVAVYLSRLNAGVERPKMVPAPVDTNAPAMNLNAGPVAVKPLDDPGNPYREAYQPWDHWAWENLLQDEFVRKDMADQPPGYVCLRCPVDEAGYMIPHHIGIMLFEQSRTNDENWDTNHGLTWVRAEGIIDEGMRRDMYDAGFAVQATFFPEIPDWLGNDPPLKAMLLPNGEIVTEGVPGDWEARKKYAAPFYARYNAAGKMLSSGQTGFWWYLFYVDTGQGRPTGQHELTTDGYVRFSDPQTGEQLSVWDYDGTHQDNCGQPARDVHPFTWLSGKTIENFYRASHRDDLAPLLEDLMLDADKNVEEE